MNTAGPVRRSIAALTAALALALALAVAGAPATANAAPAKTAGPAIAAAGIFCGSAPSKHIGTWGRFGTKYTKFGTVEWRYGTSGRCKGYKWVVIHITRPGLWVEGADFQGDCGWGGYVRAAARHSSWVFRCWYGWSSSGTFYLPPLSSWHSNAMYGYHVSLDSYVWGRSSKGNPLYLGNDPHGTFAD